MSAVNGPDSTKRQSRLGRTQCAPEGVRSEATNQIRCTDVRRTSVELQSKFKERCQSGRMGLIRNQVYGSPVPWVRIPPSPPKYKRPLSGPFVFLPSRLRTSDPVRRAQPHSGMPGREATIPPSPPKYKRPLSGPFVFLPSGLRTSDPVRPTQPRSGMLAGSSRSEQAESHPDETKRRPHKGRLFVFRPLECYGATAARSETGVRVP